MSAAQHDPAGFPSSYSTQQAPPPRRASGLNINYVLTLPGLLKCAELGLGFMTWLLAACAELPVFRSGFGSWFLFVSIVAWIGTIGLLVVFVTGLYSRVDLNWVFIDLIYSGVVILLYFIANIVVAAMCGGNGTYIAALIFGILTMGCYGAGAFFNFRSYKAGDTLPSGDPVIGGGGGGAKNQPSTISSNYPPTSS